MAIAKKILFLGYDENETKLIPFLRDNGCEVYQTKEQVDSQFAQGFDLIVSFGYRHIIRQNFIDAFKGDIVNLHISYLPYNRGASPNFWAFYDGTPHGVTIHLIDAGVDTGPILFQRPVIFHSSENTFGMTYKRLTQEIESLFMENWEVVQKGTYVPKAQVGKGTHHFAKDLPAFPGGWNRNISEVIAELKRAKKIA